MKTIKIALLLTAFATGALAAGAVQPKALAAGTLRTVQVTGKSTTSLPAHCAVIHAVIRHVRPDMEQSHTEVTQSLAQLTRNLEAVGLSGKDIVPTLIQQGEQYRWVGSSKVHEGFYSQCRLEIRVDDLARLHNVYSELSQHEELTIYGTEYHRNDEFEVRQAEFEKALLAARAKAQHMARVLDSGVDRVHNIREMSSQDYTTRLIYSNVTSQERDEDSQGVVVVEAVVEVVFELE
jgi:uncharacterized protein YggE